MQEMARIVIGVAGGLAIIGVGIGLAWRDRRQLSAAEAAWRGFAAPRGYGFSPHQGGFWVHPGVGTTPRIWGAMGGVHFVIELTGWRAIDQTRVVATCHAPPWTPGLAAELSADRLEGEAAQGWQQLRHARPDARMETSQLGGQLALFVGWTGLERDPAVLDGAIALVAELGRHPPTHRPAAAGPATPG